MAKTESFIVVGTGGDFWDRRPNRYAGCSCPPEKYLPWAKKTTDPACAKHGIALGSEQQENTKEKETV